MYSQSACGISLGGHVSFGLLICEFYDTFGLIQSESDGISACKTRVLGLSGLTTRIATSVDALANQSWVE